jgi:hypothetical protein
MQCGSCAEEIPNDSIFCPECGARQEVSRAGSFANTGSVGLGGQEVTGGRNFGVVSGEAVRQQREMGQGQAGGLPPEVLQQIAMGVQQQQNIPQGQFPPQQGHALHTKWASSHLKAFRRNKACLPTKWVNSHLKAFRRNKACLPTKWVNSHPKTSNRPTSWVVLDLICRSNFVAPHFPAVLFLRKIQQM